MDWRDHIYSNPEIGRGKPIFPGTRFKVEFVLQLIAYGWPFEKMAEEYPGIKPEYLQAATAFAAELVRKKGRDQAVCLSPG